MGSSSTACATGMAPTRLRIAGSWLGASGRTCRTTNRAAGKLAGSPARMVLSASTPPLEAPMTTTSRRDTTEAMQLPCGRKLDRHPTKGRNISVAMQTESLADEHVRPERQVAELQREH